MLQARVLCLLLAIQDTVLLTSHGILLATDIQPMTDSFKSNADYHKLLAILYLPPAGTYQSIKQSIGFFS
jgi:hypothetical protein